MSIKDKNLIPLIYKDYGRSRGCGDSVAAFKRYIEEISNKESLNIKPLIIEITDLPRWINTKFGIRPFKDLILFNICFIQNPEQRGFYDFIKTKKDIVFGKKVVDKNTDYIQNIEALKWLGEDFSRYFPKYYGDVFVRYRSGKRTHIKCEPDINYCWYNRSDTSPVQTSFYNMFIDELVNNYPYKLENLLVGGIETNNNFVQSFGYNNDIPVGDLFDKCDIILYTAPDHFDPFPNTIFHALINNLAVIEIVNPNTGKTDPGFQMLKEYFPHKVYSTTHWMQYVKNDFEDFSIYNTNQNIGNIRRFKNVVRNTIFKNTEMEDYALHRFYCFVKETKDRLKRHILNI